MKTSAIFGLAVALAAASILSARAGDLTEQYTLKQRCGEQAAKFFAAGGDKEGMDNTPAGTTSTSYEAHFNPKTLKCFISYTYDTNPFRDKTLRRSTSQTLVEVNENKTYGSLFVFADGAVMDCTIGGQKCGSEAEWKVKAAAITGE